MTKIKLKNLFTAVIMCLSCSDGMCSVRTSDSLSADERTVDITASVVRQVLSPLEQSDYSATMPSLLGTSDPFWSEEIPQLQTQVEQLSRRIQEQDERFDQQQRNMKAITKTLTALRTGMSQKADKLAVDALWRGKTPFSLFQELQEHVGELQGKLDALKELWGTYSESCSSLTGRTSTLEKKSQEQDDAIESLRKKRKKADESIRQIGAGLAKLDAQVKTLTSATSSSSETKGMNALRKQGIQESRIAALEEKNREQGEKIRQQDEEIRRQGEQIQFLMSMFSLFSSGAISTEISGLRGQVDILSQQVDALQDSFYKVHEKMNAQQQLFDKMIQTLVPFLAGITDITQKMGFGLLPQVAQEEVLEASAQSFGSDLPVMSRTLWPSLSDFIQFWRISPRDGITVWEDFSFHCLSKIMKVFSEGAVIDKTQSKPRLLLEREKTEEPSSLSSDKESDLLDSFEQEVADKLDVALQKLKGNRYSMCASLFDSRVAKNIFKGMLKLVSEPMYNAIDWGNDDQVTKYLNIFRSQVLKQENKAALIKFLEIQQNSVLAQPIFRKDVWQNLDAVIEQLGLVLCVKDLRQQSEASKEEEKRKNLPKFRKKEEKRKEREQEKEAKKRKP